MMKVSGLNSGAIILVILVCFLVTMMFLNVLSDVVGFRITLGEFAALTTLGYFTLMVIFTIIGLAFHISKWIVGKEQ